MMLKHDAAAWHHRRQAHRWRLKHGRLALPGFHVSDVAWPRALIELGRLRPDQEDDRAAIRDATIELLDDLCLGAIDRR